MALKTIKHGDVAFIESASKSDVPFFEVFFQGSNVASFKLVEGLQPYRNIKKTRYSHVDLAHLQTCASEAYLYLFSARAKDPNRKPDERIVPLVEPPKRQWPANEIENTNCSDQKSNIGRGCYNEELEDWLREHDARIKEVFGVDSSAGFIDVVNLPQEGVDTLRDSLIEIINDAILHGDKSKFREDFTKLAFPYAPLKLIYVDDLVGYRLYTKGKSVFKDSLTQQEVLEFHKVAKSEHHSFIENADNWDFLKHINTKDYVTRKVNLIRHRSSDLTLTGRYIISEDSYKSKSLKGSYYFNSNTSYTSAEIFEMVRSRRIYVMNWNHFDFLQPYYKGKK